MRLPYGLKVAYSFWMLVWIPAYWIHHGPANFLWLCDLANLLVALALWVESPLLFASQAVAVLLIQAAWVLDYFGRLLLGFHPIGGTEYMFDASKAPWVRGLSLFHLFMPALLLWSIWRLGYDRRGWLLQSAIGALVLPMSFFAAGPDKNLNWLWSPFGIRQTLIPPGYYLLLCIVAYPAVIYWPTHRLLQWWMRRSGRPLLPQRAER